MKTNKKSFVALLATFAVGTAVVAGLAFAKSGNNGFIAHADTAKTVSAVSINSVSTVNVGTNSVELQAGEEKVLTLSVTNVGSYGFKWVSGSAAFKFEGLTESVDDETTGETSEAYTYGLNSEVTSFYVAVSTPETATVTITSDEDTTIVFEVSYLIDTGNNHISLKAGVSQTFALNSNLVGTYGFEWTAGEATMTISGVGTYTLSESNATVSVDINLPSTTEITFASATDVELKFVLTYSAEYTDLVIGSNSLTLTANDVQNCIIGTGVEGETAPAGYYTFTKVGTVGFASFEFLIDGEVQVKTLDRINTTFTVYLNAPSTTVIPAYYSVNTSINFTISYSETDPNAASGNTLSEGPQTVNATGDGVEYTFTSENGGSYELKCTDSNAFIMVLVTYIDPYYGVETSEWEWIEDTSAYSFTLTAGGTINFLMSTNNWKDDTYEVTIADADNN